MDLYLDSNSGISLYEQIYDYFANKISYGDYKPRDRLPTYKAISAEYGVSLSTVQTAYRKLEREGYIEMSNRGSYVNELNAPFDKLLSQRLDSVIRFAENRGAGKKDISAALEVMIEKYC